MQNKKDTFIDQLLRDIKMLEERVITAKSSNTLPFSFFNESFHDMQQIERLLHEMQLMQIEEMKHQMEHLVKYLSDSANKRQPMPESASVTTTTIEQDESATVPTTLKDDSGMHPASTDKKPVVTIDEDPSLHKGNRFADRISLPAYTNPRNTERAAPLMETVPHSKTASPTETASPVTEIEREEKLHVTTLNDAIQAPPAVLDLKRGISLNDRFLFQRELFNNDRHAMNNLMIQLNAFDSFESVDLYLRKSMPWNFDDPVVKDFLRVLKKGFE